MDIFSMLQTATIVDAETGETVGGTIGFEVEDGRLTLKAILFDYIEDDPDGGEEVPVGEINKGPTLVEMTGSVDLPKCGTNHG